MLHAVAVDHLAKLLAQIFDMRLDHIVGSALKDHLRLSASFEALDFFSRFGSASQLRLVVGNHIDLRFLPFGNHHRKRFEIVVNAGKLEYMRKPIDSNLVLCPSYFEE